MAKKSVGSVSVILPTRNNEESIEYLLEALFAQSFKGTIEVVILDSSDDRTPDIAKRWSQSHDVRVVRVEPADYNYGGTRNLGASMTEGDMLVFISTDVEIRDNRWLTKLVKNLDDPLVAGVFGRQIPKEGASPMEEFFIKYTYPEERKCYYLGNTGRLREFFFSNTNSVIRRAVWETIPLPEMLKSEDQEWAKRALLAGYKIVYEPDAPVYHSHHYTLPAVFREYFDSGATMPYVYRDDRVAARSFLVRGVDYEWSQLRYFLANNYLKTIPYSLVYDVTKFLGYVMGTRCEHMPTWLRKALCKKENHWAKYECAVPVEGHES